MNNKYYVYIITNYTNSVLYTGVTNDLNRRIDEHKAKLVKGFSKKYNLNKLVYYEEYDNINDAILREKQIKKGPRKRKMELIEGMNEKWLDLAE